MDFHSTERFTGLAQLYAASRPSYPADAVDFIIEHCHLTSESLMVDVGCGTGISTRLFAERGICIFGIEPNDDMRKTAEKIDEEQRDKLLQIPTGNKPGKKGIELPRYWKGTAEDTQADDELMDVVLCAQAFHWFDPDKALSEFFRILKPDGFVVLMWNERDEENDDFTKGYGDLFRTLPDTKNVEMKRGSAGQPLLESELFRSASRRDFRNQQEMDRNGLLGRAFSASYAPREGEAAETLEKGLIELFDKYQRDEVVNLHYITSVYTARR